MNRIRVKACGMTSAKDAEFAVSCGVDAIGMILHANSPREIDIKAAQEIRKVVPAFVTLVGVFVDAEPDLVTEIHKLASLDLLQFHGAETEEYCNSFNLPFIKALRVKDKKELESQLNSYKQSRAFLLDPYVKGIHGGTGKQLDMGLWPDVSEKKLILAGGLAPENIHDAIKMAQPYAVDVNSGVEDAPGVKNHQRLSQFIDLVKNC